MVSQGCSSLAPERENPNQCSTHSQSQCNREVYPGVIRAQKPETSQPANASANTWTHMNNEQGPINKRSDEV